MRKKAKEKASRKAKNELKGLGVDLAAYERNPSGVAVVEGRRVETALLYEDEAILKEIAGDGPDIVAIDAPLALPEGGKGLRPCDRELISLGLRVFPPGFRHMKALTARGIKLAGELREGGFEVIEVHPRSSQKRLGIEGVEGLGGLGFLLKKRISRHELDAVLAAYTGVLYLEGRAEKVGDEREGCIVLPGL